jgi:acetyl-CoA decarbonylase/synthase, CODH/ACS complex subunit gamma
MAKLTGLKIQKLLPKTNCKECGSNTCLAFAMKLAGGKADLADCPYASDEAKAILGAAAEPPVKGVAFGPDKSIKVGEETCFYRHEKTFVNQTLFAVNVNDTDSAEVANAVFENVKNYELERVGEFLTVEMIAITQKGDDPAAFAALAEKAWKTTNKPLILNGRDVKAVEAAAVAIKGSNSLVGPATPENADAMVEIAKANEHGLMVSAPDLNALVLLTAKIKNDGFNDLVLNFQTMSLAEQFQINSIARKAALRDAYKPLGYASVAFINQGDLLETSAAAINETCKYGGICVLPEFDKAQLVAMMALRQNIYTDPQKPIQVEPKLYQIGEPTPESPVFVTTNFSLTYFIVSGEIENSGLSAWLVIPECEGMSVLTAWAAGKFSGATIGKFCKEIELDNAVKSRQLVIPGYVAQISGDLEENMPGWEIIVGTQEASDIEGFVKQKFAGFLS